MPLDLVPCPFCSRLYSNHSLPHHTAKCLANPDNAPAPVKRMGSSSSRAKTPKRRNTTSGRARSTSRPVSSAAGGARRALHRSQSVGAPDRPGTRTINNNNANGNGNAKTTSFLAPKRPCFVCGRPFLLERLDAHARHCEAQWRAACAHMPATIRTQSPHAVQIPSLDGTRDPVREDQLALRSAERAQRAHCLRCQMEFAFKAALAHKCRRFEPTVEFFF